MQPRSLVDVNAPLEEQEQAVEPVDVRTRIEKALVVLRAVLVEEHRALPAPTSTGDAGGLRVCDELQREVRGLGRVVDVDGEDCGLVVIVPELVLVDVEERGGPVAVHGHVPWVACWWQGGTSDEFGFSEMGDGGGRRDCDLRFFSFVLVEMKYEKKKKKK